MNWPQAFVLAVGIVCASLIAMIAMANKNKNK